MGRFPHLRRGPAGAQVRTSPKASRPSTRTSWGIPEGPWKSCWSSLLASWNPAPHRLQGQHTDDLLRLRPQRPHSGCGGRNAPSWREAGREPCGHSEAARWPWLVAVSPRRRGLVVCPWRTPSRVASKPSIPQGLASCGSRAGCGSLRGERRSEGYFVRGCVWLRAHRVCASPRARAQGESGLALQGRAQGGHGWCRLRPTWLTLHESGMNEQAFTGWQAEPQAPDVLERASSHAAPDRLAFCWTWV